MKRIFLSLFFLSLVSLAFGQNDKFQQAMLQNIAKLDAAKTIEDLTDVAASFERIGSAETTKWEPYYYAALSNIWIGFKDEKADRDALADKADGFISKAFSLQPKNSEVVLLKSMSATLHMIVDPMNRWQKYGADLREAMMTARQLDPDNPRTYYWEAQNLMGTPEQFGGGKAKAKPIFEKSVELYKSFKPATPLSPVWGEGVTKQMLEACKAD